jgi:hypothetical protein
MLVCCYCHPLSLRHSPASTSFFDDRNPLVKTCEIFSVNILSFTMQCIYAIV